VTWALSVCENVNVSIDSQATIVNDAIDAFLAESDPKSMDPIAFRGARYDAGLA